MMTIRLLIKRNVKLFFKEKGMFFTSLITPAILLVLYTSFLGNVYRDTFLLTLPEFIKVSDAIVDGYVAAQLCSSILSVSCVTVAFCSNFLIVQDKVNGSIKDLRMTPVSSTTLSLSYYIASFLSTLIICFSATALCLGYIALSGWYMSIGDVLLLLLDVVLLTLFGTALSSVINFFLSTQGHISAVGTLISSCYGFVCGAYMPISSFNEGIRNVISFLPGTYGTVLVKNHLTLGVFSSMENEGVSAELIEKLKDGMDCNFYFFGDKVSILSMYLVVCLSILVLIGVYILQNLLKKKAK